MHFVVDRGWSVVDGYTNAVLPKRMLKPLIVKGSQPVNDLARPRLSSSVIERWRAPNTSRTRRGRPGRGQAAEVAAPCLQIRNPKDVARSPPARTLGTIGRRRT
jgi:hypothetical protein